MFKLGIFCLSLVFIYELWPQFSYEVSYGGRIQWRPSNNYIMFVPRALVITPRFASSRTECTFSSFSLLFSFSSHCFFLEKGGGEREREKIFYLAEIIRSVVTYARLYAINLFLLALASIISSRSRIPVIATGFNSWIRKYPSGGYFHERWRECELRCAANFLLRNYNRECSIFYFPHFLSTGSE